MVAEIKREIELADYIEVFLKRKWFILLATLTGLAGGWWMTEAPSAAFYQAKVLLMIKSSAQDGQDSEISVLPRALDFYKSLALADDLRQDLIDSLGLKRSLSSLDGVMSANTVGQNALELTVSSPDSELPVGLVNLWAEFFLDRNRGLTVEDLGNRYEWVVRQYEIAKQNLERGEDALNHFEASNSIADLELQQALFDSTHRALQAELHTLRLNFQHNSDNLERQVLSVKLVELENPFFKQSLSDSNVFSNIELPEVVDFVAKQRVEQILRAQEENARKYQSDVEENTRKYKSALVKLEQEQALALHKFEQEERIALDRFEKKTNFSQLKQSYEKLTLETQEILALIGRDSSLETQEILALIGRDSTRFLLTEKITIAKLREELQRHEPTIPGSKEVNPIYIELGQKLVDLSLNYETTQALEAAAKDRVDLEMQKMIEVGQAYQALAPIHAEFVLERAQKRIDFDYQVAQTKAEFEYQANRLTGQFERENKSRATDLEKNLEYWQGKRDLSYQASWERYMSSMSAILALKPQVEVLKNEVLSREIIAAQTQEELKTLKDSLALLLVQRERLGRTQQIQQESFDRFAKLFEETRIAREKAAGDIRLLTRAIEPRRLPGAIGERKTLIGGGVGFLLSTILAMLVEYTYQARLRRRRGAEAH